MSATAVQLHRVLAVTPMPRPHDPVGLLAQAAEVLAARDAVLAELVVPLPLLDAADRDAWAEVAARHTAWTAAVEIARDELVGRRTAARRLVAYDVSADDVGFEHVG